MILWLSASHRTPCGQLWVASMAEGIHYQHSGRKNDKLIQTIARNFHLTVTSSAFIFTHTSQGHAQS
jgi:frataxin-like iron-binding protein CyaY